VKPRIFLIVILFFLLIGNISWGRISGHPSSREGSPPYIEFVKGSFGGPYYATGWLWVRPGQVFRIAWSAGDVRWCEKWSLDPGFRGPARARGEYWTRLYGPNPHASHGGWVFGLTCGNGVAPNAVARIWVKVVS